jgi:hypothetical protein
MFTSTCVLNDCCTFWARSVHWAFYFDYLVVLFEFKVLCPWACLEERIHNRTALVSAIIIIIAEPFSQTASTKVTILTFWTFNSVYLQIIFVQILSTIRTLDCIFDHPILAQPSLELKYFLACKYTDFSA